MLKHYVMSDEEIVRSARTMIRAHGGRAGLICAETAERWSKRGDVEAAELWTRILHVVRKLELDIVGMKVDKDQTASSTGLSA